MGYSGIFYTGLLNYEPGYNGRYMVETGSNVTVFEELFRADANKLFRVNTWELLP